MMERKRIKVCFNEKDPSDIKYYKGNEQMFLNEGQTFAEQFVKRITELMNSVGYVVRVDAEYGNHTILEIHKERKCGI